MKKILTLLMILSISSTALSSAQGAEITMTQEDEKLILEYKEVWQKSFENNDTTAMEIAHNLAESVRAKYGFSGGKTGNENIISRTENELEISLKNEVISTKTKNIQLILDNISTNDVVFTEEYKIYKTDEECKKEIVAKDGSFVGGLNVIESTGFCVIDISLANFDDLEVGTYTLEKEFMVSTDQTKILSTNFKVTDKIKTIGTVLSINQNQVDILAGGIVSVFDIINANEYKEGSIVYVIDTENGLLMKNYNY